MFVLHVLANLQKPHHATVCEEFRITAQVRFRFMIMESQSNHATQSSAADLCSWLAVQGLAGVTKREVVNSDGFSSSFKDSACVQPWCIQTCPEVVCHQL